MPVPGVPSPATLPPFPKDSSRQPRRSWEALTDLTMLISAALGPGIARIFYYPTLFYTLVRARLPGSQRSWFNRIDRAVVLGALPLRGRCRQVTKTRVCGIPRLPRGGPSVDGAARSPPLAGRDVRRKRRRHPFPASFPSALEDI